MPYRVIDKKVVHDGSKVRLELHQLENVVTGARHRREVAVHPGAVVILGVLDDDRILLIRSYRHAVGQYLIELPAGTLEKNEDPINCAGRELLEETGYLAGRLKPLMNFFSSPGLLSERMFVFSAHELQLSQTALEEGEEIQVLPTRWDDAIEMVRNGEIQDAKSIAILMMCNDRRQRGQTL